MTDPNTPACPVAALADEAQRLIDAFNVVDEADTEAAEDQTMEGKVKKFHIEAIKQATNNFLDGVLDRASVLRATSAKGALFQIGIASSFASSLEVRVLDAARAPQTNVVDWEDEKRTACKKQSSACFIL